MRNKNISFNKKIILKPKKNKKSDNINLNCWLVKTFHTFPSKHCRYCEMKITDCPFFRFLIMSIVLLSVSLFGFFLIEGKIFKSFIFFLLLFIFSYGYLYNKTTKELITGKFFFKKAKEDLEESEVMFKIRVKARTRQLQELSDSLEEQVKEKTKELQDRINELEKFHRLTVGRELKMMEIKREMKKLEKGLSKTKEKNKPQK